MQIHELFREVAQCVQQGGEQLQCVDHMVDDAHAGGAALVKSRSFLKLFQKLGRVRKKYCEPASITAATLGLVLWWAGLLEQVWARC
jgi:hypothetical protein